MQMENNAKKCQRKSANTFRYLLHSLLRSVLCGISMSLKRFQSVAQFLTRSVKRAMKINAR